MKKIIMISLILLVIFLSSGSAFAHRIHFRGWIGPHIFLPPPPIVFSPPGVYFRGYYPPPAYYEPYYEPHRVWVPGHWEERQTPYGWERVWVPGYWRYGP